MGSVSFLAGRLHVAWVMTDVAETHAWGYCGALLAVPPVL